MHCNKSTLILTTLYLSTVNLCAAPYGSEVLSGIGSVSHSDLTTTVNQSSQILSLKWNSFNIAPNETVNFLQPSSTAIAINHIYTTDGTQILGHLNANGQVYLINPNGILFGRGSQVNVGALVASTLEMNDNTLNDSIRSFNGSNPNSIINQGSITTADGGYVALIGSHVSNEGVITAHLGSVVLGSGSTVLLTFDGNTLIGMEIEHSVLDSLSENGGLIRADGGLVIMSSGAKESLRSSVVNNIGVIEARTVENRNGTIVLLGGMNAGVVSVGGTLDASAPNGGNGGSIETSGAHVTIANDARITTASALGINGIWLIDPVDFTVASSGGDTLPVLLPNKPPIVVSVPVTVPVA
jgi:filamentous hemagglutinin family protein